MSFVSLRLARPSCVRVSVESPGMAVNHVHHICLYRRVNTYWDADTDARSTLYTTRSLKNVNINLIGAGKFAPLSVNSATSELDLTQQWCGHS